MSKRKRGGASASAKREDDLAFDPSASKLAFNSYEDIPDSEDEFYMGKDKILLNGEGASKRSKYGNAEDDEMQLSDEEVLRYSSNDDDEDQDASDNEHANGGVFDESGGSGDEDADSLSGWGPSKADYYDADTIQTEQDALEEEEEARRIQQKRLKALTEADFGFDENEWRDSGKPDLEDKRSDEEDGVVTEILPQLQITDDMGPAERLKLLKTRYPEFEPLSQELVELQPLYTEMVAQSATNSDKVSKLKLNALSGYLGSLAMYFAILTSSASTNKNDNLPLPPQELREHEIMDALVRSREMWEDVKDIQAPLTHEESIQDESELSEVSEEESDLDDQPLESQPSAKREKHYQPKDAAPKDPEVEASLARRAARLKENEKSLAALKASLKANKAKSTPSDQSLQPSRKDTNPQVQELDMDSDLGDEPDPVRDGDRDGKPRRKKSLKFYTSQIAQKSAKHQNAGRNAGGDEDVPHRERLRDRQERLNREAEKRGRRKAAEPDEDDEDVEETNQEREARLGGVGGDAGDLDGDEQQLLQRMLAKKEDKLARREGRTGAKESHGMRRDQLADGNFEYQGDGRREISYAIAKNKGLVPVRKKEIKNPRVKKRKRYEDKKKKLRSMRPTYSGGEGRGGYSGEATGIKKNLVRATKLS